MRGELPEYRENVCVTTETRQITPGVWQSLPPPAASALHSHLQLQGCCALWGLDTLYPLVWVPAWHSKPQRSRRASGPFGGLCVMAPWLWVPGILPKEVRGSGLLWMAGLVAGCSHSSAGPLLGGCPLNRAWPREEDHCGAGHLRKAGHGPTGPWVPWLRTGHRLREGESGSLPHTLSKAPWALILTSAYPRLHPSRKF